MNDVAHDFYASKYILLPETRKAAPESDYVSLNDPDNTEGPFHEFLRHAARETGGAMDDSKTRIVADKIQ